MPWLSLLFDAYAIIDKGVEVAISREKRKEGKRPACRDICDVCCRANTDIPVYPLELAGMTWYAVERVGDEVRDILRQQLLSHEGRPPCPFLVEHRCSVYPVRPVACRQYIVFGKTCAEEEDPFYSRREDVLLPIREFTDQAVMLMLPFYGITRETDKITAIKNGYIHSKVQNIHSCNWKSLSDKMDACDPRSFPGIRSPFQTISHQRNR